jgi:hypothetical protein
MGNDVINGTRAEEELCKALQVAQACIVQYGGWQ